tara:strand:- start:1456 stop:1611 length:156 start_codon:yes stop_codon:yes gene_type:complete
MKQLIINIKGKQYLISSLKGFSERKFLKEGQGSKEDYEQLKPFINPKKKDA